MESTFIFDLLVARGIPVKKEDSAILQKQWAETQSLKNGCEELIQNTDDLALTYASNRRDF